MSLPELFANAYATTLNGGIDNATATIQVNDAPPATLTPGGQFRILVDQEYMIVTAVGAASSTTWTVLRGQEGSAAASHSSGAAVNQVLTAGALGELAQLGSDGTIGGPTGSPLSGAVVTATPASTAYGRRVIVAAAGSQTGPGHGPLVVQADGQYFVNGAPEGNNSSGGAIYDPVVRLGYNCGEMGAPIVGGESQVAWVVEGDYQRPDGNRTMEAYLEAHNSSNGILVRPFGTQFIKSAAQVEIFQQQTSVCGLPVVLQVPQTGAPAGQAQVAAFFPNETILSSVASADNVLKINSQAGANAALILGSGTNQSAMRIGPSGSSQGVIQVNGQTISIGSNNSNGAAWMGINTSNNGASLTVDGVGDFASHNILVLRSRSPAQSQSANILEIQDSKQNALIHVTPSAHPSLVVGNAVLGTNATDGFIYIPTVSGPPSGVPTAKTGTVPIVFDTANNKLMLYTGGKWLGAKFS